MVTGWPTSRNGRRHQMATGLAVRAQCGHLLRDHFPTATRLGDSSAAVEPRLSHSWHSREREWRHRRGLRRPRSNWRRDCERTACRRRASRFAAAKGIAHARQRPEVVPARLPNPAAAADARRAPLRVRAYVRPRADVLRAPLPRREAMDGKPRSSSAASSTPVAARSRRGAPQSRMPRSCGAS